MSAGWGQYRNNVVARIREQPLDHLDYLDVLVPPRPGPLICARLTLIHLLHTCYDVFGDREPRIFDFLRASPRPLARDEVRCDTCWNFAEDAIESDLLVPTLRRQRRNPESATQP
jgi:hypothetical protein